MKKTITINLAGVVFHIEEDAYQILQQYLDSIRNYFSKFKGGDEIQSDIELRIAEIFGGIITPNKQAVTLDDVENLIRQMGQVEEMTEELELEEENTNQSQSSENQSKKEPNWNSGNKKLVRDSSNAIIAGVCSGIAAYFEVNPLWVRLAVLVFAFGIFWMPNFFWPVFIAYVVLWISMPSSPFVENKGQYKKFFRSRKDKVVAGLAAGLGKYTSIDPVIFRILFVLTTFFGGFGLITYLILWAITPEAKTITDEIQMEGEPVTLNNIEEQIKKNINIENPETKKTITKVATFPFRIIEVVVQGLGNLLKVLFDVARVLLGMLLLFVSGVFLFALGVTLLVAMGVITNQAAYHIETAGFPLDMISQEISPWMIGFGGLTAIIPAIFIFLVSISLLSNRNLLKPVVLMVLFSLLLVGGMGSAITIIPLANSFSTHGENEVKIEFEMPSKLISLNMNEMENARWDKMNVNLELHGYDDKKVKLIERFKARGKDRKEANENARQIQYNVVQQDSTLIFDSGFSLESGIPYRLQRVELDLYLPYGQNFKADGNLEKILINFYSESEYEDSNLEGNIWMFNQDGLKCMTCIPKTKKETDNEDEDF